MSFMRYYLFRYAERLEVLDPPSRFHLPYDMYKGSRIQGFEDSSENLKKIINP